VKAACARLTRANVVLAQLEVPLACVVAALEWGRQTGAQTILDPAPAMPLGGEILALVDVVRPNAREAEVLTGIHVDDRDSARDAAKALLQRGAKTAIVQAGDDGNLLVTREAEHWLAKLPVQSVDATGAGDAFVGALATYLAKGRSLIEAFTLANAAAALATTAFGAQAPVITEDQLHSLLARS
jgi:ribokinase